jgi:2-(1,2-epoxy-1,2-dihydrophenyl)acetyl-CoA isomerase
MPTALGLARQLADGPASLGMMRRLVWDALSSNHDDALEAERHAQKRAAATDDHREGIAAFQGKRAPAFTGR